MGARITAAQVWMQLEKQLFGVVGLVTAKGEARTVGIAYLVRYKKFYLCTNTNAWKTKHLRNNPNVSMTVPIVKRHPFLVWVKIPAATITLSGTGRILDLTEVPPEIPDTLLKHLKPTEEVRRDAPLIEIIPKGYFIAYGVGVPLRSMLRRVETGGLFAPGLKAAQRHSFCPRQVDSFS